MNSYKILTPDKNCGVKKNTCESRFSNFLTFSFFFDMLYTLNPCREGQEIKAGQLIAPEVQGLGFKRLKTENC